MRIAIINSLYYPQFLGGAEVSVQTLSESLAKRHVVYVISLAAEKGITKNNGVLNLKIRTPNIYPYGDFKQRRLFKLIWHLIDSFNFVTMIKFYFLLKRIRPQVLHTNNLQGISPSVWLAAKILGIPIVHTFRDYYLFCHGTQQYRDGKCDGLCFDCKVSYKVKQTFFKLPKTYIGISRFILDRHIHYMVVGDAQLQFVVGNSTSPPSAGCNILKRNLRSKIAFGFLGRVSKDKGIEYLLDEFSRLKGNKACLIVAGECDAEYRAYLDATFDTNNVQFIGRTSREKFFGMIDVLIVPSVWDEPFGRVAIEAKHFKVPACISSSGGLQELFDERSMWLFDITEGALLNLLREIANDPGGIKQKSAACDKGFENYSTDYIADKYLQIYRETISKSL